MSEFDLIAAVIEALGPTSRGAETILGPGDDCAVVRVPEGEQLVTSIDTLVGGVHVPASAPATAIGFRSMCVSFSDVAAMGGRPGFATVALTHPDGDADWLREFAAGVARAAERFGCTVAGGNLARGPLNVSVSANGYVAADQAVRRSGAIVGDRICIGDALGAAAEAWARDDLSSPPELDELLELTPNDPGYPLRRYYAPEPDFELASHLPGVASAAIDVSDGLLADLGHLCAASGVGAAIDVERIPRFGETMRALSAGDDYVLCFTLAADAAVGLVRAFSHVAIIGTVIAEPGLRDADGVALEARGFDHFSGR